MQLESAFTSKKRKRDPGDIDGEEESPMKMRSYGIVTDASKCIAFSVKVQLDEKAANEARLRNAEWTPESNE
ncbi:hypothetical protein BGZ65_006234 [Modicella reniformis]|uniref:Uncharacterized protein n=1 Tax=Modicella reniformis TaxID=1440133 RepID=A0A9P6JHD6_9FUNG|nr:hypothetical protein BGZ65_006234 [Modicella reniformis]